MIYILAEFRQGFQIWYVNMIITSSEAFISRFHLDHWSQRVLSHQFHHITINILMELVSKFHCPRRRPLKNTVSKRFSFICWVEMWNLLLTSICFRYHPADSPLIMHSCRPLDDWEDGMQWALINGGQINRQTFDLNRLWKFNLTGKPITKLQF